MSTTAQLVTSSQRHRPRQFEFHPRNDSLIFGTLTGSVYYVSDVTSDERRSIKPLGHFALENANIDADEMQIHQFDAILGLCWFRNHSHRFISGSSRGVLICGDVRDNGTSEHSIDITENNGSSGSRSSSIRAQINTTHASASSSSFLSSNNIVKQYKSFERLTSVHLNCNDSLCLVSGYKRHVRLYDVESGAVVSTYQNAHTDNINISRFANLSPNLFCTSSFDETARVWDVRQRPERPVYSIRCSSGLVMVSFSPNDAYILTSALDNEVAQHLVADGRTVFTFDIPRTGHQGNFTRAYYSASASYIFTGACEESCVNVLCASTGQRLSSIDVYPGRHHSSLYIQSLRGSPLRDNQLAVLCNYKDIGDREIVLVTLPQNDSYDSDIYPYVTSSGSELQSESINNCDNPISRMLAPPLASPLLLPSPHLSEHMSVLRSSCLTLSGAISIESYVFDNHGSGSSLGDLAGVCCVDTRAMQSSELDLCVYIGGGVVVAMHRFVALCRSTYLCTMLVASEGGVNRSHDGDSPTPVTVPLIDISGAIDKNNDALYTMPILLDFLYTGVVGIESVKQQCLRRIQDKIVKDSRPDHVASENMCKASSSQEWTTSPVLCRALIAFVDVLYSAASALELHQLLSILDRHTFSLVTPVTVVAINRVSATHGRPKLHSATMHYMRNHFDIVTAIHGHATSPLHTCHARSIGGDGGLSLAELVQLDREEHQLEFDSPIAGNAVRSHPSEEEVDAEECWSLGGLGGRPLLSGLRFPVPKVTGHCLVGVMGDCLLLAGGQSGQQRPSSPRTTHLFNTTTHTWSPVSCSDCEAPDIMMYSTAHGLQREQQRQVVFVGGHRGRELNAQTAVHVLDLLTMTWSAPAVKSSSPAALACLGRYRHCSVALYGDDQVDFRDIAMDVRSREMSRRVAQLQGSDQPPPPPTSRNISSTCHNEWLLSEDDVCSEAALRQALCCCYSAAAPPPSLCIDAGAVVASFVVHGGLHLRRGECTSLSDSIVTVVCRESVSIMRSHDGATLGSTRDSYVWAAVLPRVYDMRQQSAEREGGDAGAARDLQRVDAAAALLPRGPADGGCRMVVWGGATADDVLGLPSEVLSVRCCNPYQMVVEKVVVRGRDRPPARCCHTMDYVPAEDVMVIYGGLSRHEGGDMTFHERILSDAWLLRPLGCSLDGLDAQWEQVTLQGIPHSPRFRHQSAGSLSGHLYFFGGAERSRWTDPSSAWSKEVDPLVKVMETCSNPCRWRWLRLGNKAICMAGDPMLTVEAPLLHRDLLSLLCTDNRPRTQTHSAPRHTIALRAYADDVDASSSSSEETTFRVVGALVSARSPTFHAMLQNERFAESFHQAIGIRGYDAEVVTAFLVYLYSDVVRVDIDNVIPLLEIAQLYGCEQLEQKCNGYLLRQVSIENACALLYYADQYNLCTLKTLCFTELVRGLPAAEEENAPAAVAAREHLLGLPQALQDEFLRVCSGAGYAYLLDAWEKALERRR